MITLSEYITDNISESILSSTHTGKAHMDEEFKKYGLKPDKVTLNADGTIDYDGDVLLQFKGLTNLSKLPFKFRNVNGTFDCSRNKLTSLDGCPVSVKVNFDCGHNNLVSLVGAPKHVGRNFYCYNNGFTSLEGTPDKIEGSFDCSYNRLANLNHCPQVIKGSFYCNSNNLTSLKGGPVQVDSNYNCSDNELTSLEGLPKTINGVLNCCSNLRKFTDENVLAVCKINKNKIFV